MNFSPIKFNDTLRYVVHTHVMNTSRNETCQNFYAIYFELMNRKKIFQL